MGEGFGDGIYRRQSHRIPMVPICLRILAPSCGQLVNHWSVAPKELGGEETDLVGQIMDGDAAGLHVGAVSSLLPVAWLELRLFCGEVGCSTALKYFTDFGRSAEQRTIGSFVTLKNQIMTFKLEHFETEYNVKNSKKKEYNVKKYLCTSSLGIQTGNNQISTSFFFPEILWPLFSFCFVLLGLSSEIIL